MPARPRGSSSHSTSAARRRSSSSSSVRSQRGVDARDRLAGAGEREDRARAQRLGGDAVGRLARASRRRASRRAASRVLKAAVDRAGRARPAPARRRRALARLRSSWRQVVAPLHRLGQLDLPAAGQQRHPADLAQVHPHRVVEADAGQVVVDRDVDLVDQPRRRARLLGDVVAQVDELGVDLLDLLDLLDRLVGLELVERRLALRRRLGLRLGVGLGGGGLGGGGDFGGIDQLVGQRRIDLELIKPSFQLVLIVVRRRGGSKAPPAHGRDRPDHLRGGRRQAPKPLAVKPPTAIAPHQGSPRIRARDVFPRSKARPRQSPSSADRDGA